MDAAKNFAKGTLAAGIDETETSLVLGSGEGGKFPAAPFNAVVWNVTDHPDPADDVAVEVLRVTAKAADTLTIVRGQEGTGNPGVEGWPHNVAGKVYKLIAPPTALLVNDHLLPVDRVGDDYDVVVPGVLGIEANTLQLSSTASVRASASTPGMVMDISGTVAGLGDVDENNSGAAVLVDDSTGVVGHRGKIGTNQTASATTLGSVTKKLEIFDNAGTSLGFIPIYGSIT